MGRIVLYNHGGSANHGCEALVRTVSHIFQNNNVILLSESPKEDYDYKIDQLVDIEPALQNYSHLSFSFLYAYYQLKVKRNYTYMDVLPYKRSIGELNSEDLVISIGGDIYCYEDYQKFIKIHQLIKKRECQSILFGCSLEEHLFKDSSFVKDMQDYDLIISRESLTYQLLEKYGFTNILLAPDSAFLLPLEKKELPIGFIEGNTIGLNVSPLVEKKEVKKGIVVKNYINLINYILSQTDSSVALIPHVVWDSNDDREILRRIYEPFINHSKVIMIEDDNAMVLKGYISRCSFFVGARTHATIAAYSTGVPTLVLGYSIKSRGIARDLFGTDKDYVISIEDIKEKNSLLNAFLELYTKKDNIKKILNKEIPDYIQKINLISKEVSLFMEEE